jgi:pimeloyl-ACP methyl ester carboxylesterase
MIAVDLPGFGGSDGLNSYTADAVLEAVTEFVLKMRDQYIPGDEGKPRSSSRVVLVAHDWGALIGFRLASEAPQLADRFILSNSIHVSTSSLSLFLKSACRLWNMTSTSVLLDLSMIYC